MNYYWMYANNTDGTLAPQHSSHSPMLTTTTVTVGTNPSTVTAVTANTSVSSTNTSYASVAAVTLAGAPDETVSGLVLLDSNGNKWTVPPVTMDANGSASSQATCEFADKAISVSANGLSIETPIQGLNSVSNDASVTTKTVITIAFDSSLLPTGNTLLGPYDDSGNNNMPSDFQTGYDNPQAWLYQNGAYVSNPNYDAIQLAQAKALRMAYLTQSFEQAIVAGFPSSADGTQRTYAIDSTAMQKWTGILSLINAGAGPTSLTLKAIDGTKVTMTQAQFKQMATDGFTYFNTQEQNLWAKEDDVNAATTVSQVQAVSW